MQRIDIQVRPQMPIISILGSQDVPETITMWCETPALTTCDSRQVSVGIGQIHPDDDYPVTLFVLLRSFSPPSSPLRLVRLRWMELSLPRLKGRPVILACVLHCHGRGAHYYNLLPQMDIKRLKAASRCRILSTFTFLP